jgi:excisionase family DNA binding protein
MKTSAARVMTVKEVADYLRVNQRTVYRLAIEHRLPGFKVGTTWRFKRGDIEAWIAAQASVVKPLDATEKARSDKKA